MQLIAYFLREEPPSCPQFGGFLKAGLEQPGFAAGMNSRRLRMAWRCARLSRFGVDRTDLLPLLLRLKQRSSR